MERILKAEGGFLDSEGIPIDGSNLKYVTTLHTTDVDLAEGLLEDLGIRPQFAHVVPATGSTDLYDFRSN